MDTVLHLVALQLVGVLHEVEHVVVGHAALLDVLAGRVQAGVGGGGQARRRPGSPPVHRVGGGRRLYTQFASGQHLPGGEEQGHQEQDCGDAHR